MKSEKLKERELIIQLSKKKKTVREIAFILEISKSKASFWINRFKKTKSLENKLRSGRPTVLTKKKLNFIASAIKSKIIQSDNKAGVSSKEVLHLIENKVNKKYSPRHVQRILHKMGFTLITPRLSHIKKDEKAQEKFKIGFKKNFRKNIWVIQ